MKERERRVGRVRGGEHEAESEDANDAVTVSTNHRAMPLVGVYEGVWGRVNTNSDSEQGAAIGVADGRRVGSLLGR